METLNNDVSILRINSCCWIILCVVFFLLAACQANESNVVLPTSLPMPAFLSYAYPEQSTIISVRDYREKHGSRIEGSYFDSVDNPICVELDGYELIEEGDFGFDKENI